jgi:PAS domain S-box-containing protein
MFGDPVSSAEGDIVVLVVEDSDTDYLLLRRHFTQHDRAIRLVRVTTVAAAMDCFSQAGFDAVISDLNLPDGSGIDVLRHVRGQTDLMPIIILTGGGSEASAVRVMKTGADDYLVKDMTAFTQLPGRVLAMVARIRSEASRRQNVAELQLLKERFRDFAEAASDWFWEKGPDLKFSFVSSSAGDMLGIEPSQFIGRSLWEVIGPDLPDDWRLHETEVREHRRFRNFVCNIRTAGGEQRVMRISGKPVFDAHGTFQGYRGIGSDISDDVAVAKRLQEARDAAIRANNAKSEFLAIMSHELRTPLNAIIGFTDALILGVAGALSAQQTSYVQDVHHAGHQLLSLVNDVLDMSKIQAKSYELHLEPVGVHQALSDAMRLVAPAAQAGGVVVTLGAVDPGLVMLADCRALRQVLLNVLSNAVKFTLPDGRVDVAAAPVAAGIEITITDTGIGIKAGDIGRVTQPFQQVDGALTRKHHGTGLGLAITEGLMLEHGGRLTIDSMLGEGTRVRLFFPGSTDSGDDSAAL